MGCLDLKPGGAVALRQGGGQGRASDQGRTFGQCGEQRPAGE